MNFKRIEPQAGHESVWDYPRPPKVENCSRHLRVVCNDMVIAETSQSKRVLETSHPPVFYIPIADIRADCLILSERSSWCEWKGEARYYSILADDRMIKDAAWFYPEPLTAYAALKEHVAFYPSLMDACYVDNEKVQAQEGDFYGGWITSEDVGPFKGGPRTSGW